MKLLLLLSIFSNIVVFSQSGLDVKYTTNNEGTKFQSELFYSNESSLYINYTKDIKPGTAHFNDRDEMVGEMIESREEFFKDFKKDSVYSESNISYVTKKILKESLKFDWKIDYSKTKTILNYNCFQAKTEFRGRSYTAFFSKDLKIPDGPRKFANLPGLILELKEDSGKLEITATSISDFKGKIHTQLNISSAKNLDSLISEAKNLYYSTKEKIEKESNSHIHTDFSSRLEVFDLN
ncbi:GLPGLI family protein [Halpernia frigidisoli]|uniref:GLPGLI family protein n=1 Tax=Halpernia frigidisoli TaxID=1125876 RepID=A0A1I3FZ44_9FLAO|nr:GLPGLI family protein [Halpernia frigidisoli]SFI16464.1 GLPGLI family protein [Halpernia frigidisoli]